MASVKKVNQKLRAVYGGAVTARLADGVLTLQGSLPVWADVVAAGRMAACPRQWSVVNEIVWTGGAIPPMRVPPVQDESLADTQWDVLIIGAGVTGCAIARELSRKKLRVLLCEKEHDVALHASSRNDGMIHPGVDLHKGTKKFAYNLRGNALYPLLCKELGVPFRYTGQTIGVSSLWMKLVLPVAPLYWLARGIPCRYTGKKALRALEPELRQNITCGLTFPTAGIVCPYGLTIALAENAVSNGVRLSLDTAVLGMTVCGGAITEVRTNRGTVRPRVVINAAGTFSEEVAAMAKDHFFSIHPRKGTNSILDKKAAKHIRTIASSLSTAATKTAHSKGGGLVSTVDGNLLVGPDAVETFDKEDFSTEKSSVDATFQKQRSALPVLSEGDIITYFTGVRAPTYEEDFVIERGRATHNLVHAAGIQSPGLTAAPAIAQDVAAMAVELLGGAANSEAFCPVRRPIPRTAELPDAERAALIAARPDYGVMVCRCEEVSRGEILDALRRPVPCDTVDGVKRRVRPGMGRCQGGFCGPLVAEIIAQEKHLPLAQVEKNGWGSELVFGETKTGKPEPKAPAETTARETPKPQLEREASLAQNGAAQAEAPNEQQRKAGDAQ